MKLNNGKISSVANPDNLLYMRSTLYQKRKENYGIGFQNCGLSGYVENKIYAFWFQNG